MKQQFSAFGYKVVNQADDILDIYVDGIIVDAETQTILKNWFGDETSTSYKSFRDQVTAANPKTINLFVNSDGGMVHDAMAIHDFMSDLETKGVTVYRKVRGLAASAATFLIMGNKSSMSENSWLMIHNVSGVAYGNVDDLERYAATARKINDSIVSFYTKKTGMSEKDIQDMMNKETWMTAEEAKEKGFIDSIDGRATFSNKIKNDQWQFENKTVLNAYNANVSEPDENNHSFLSNIKSEAMKLIDSLKATLKNAKEDKGTDKIDNKAAILDMVEKVLTPFANAIDEKIKDEEVVEETAEQKEAREAKEKEEKEKKEGGESEVENKKITALETELNNLKQSLALNKANPKAAKTSADIMKDVQIEYQQS